MARKKDEKSGLLSGLGRAFQVFKVIVDAVLEKGGNDSDLIALLSDKRKVKRRLQEIAKLIVIRIEVRPSLFELWGDETLDDMVAIGEYDRVLDVTTEAFPLESVDDGEGVEVEILAICFNETMHDDEVVAWFQEHGLRFANTAETLTFFGHRGPHTINCEFMGAYRVERGTRYTLRLQGAQFAGMVTHTYVLIGDRIAADDDTTHPKETHFLAVTIDDDSCQKVRDDSKVFWRTT